MHKNKNLGFTLIELIIVIAIISVLLGIITPQYLKYVEKAKRTTDVTTARQIHDIYERIAITDGLSTSVEEYNYTMAMMWNKDSKLPTTPTNIMDEAFIEMGKIPISAVDKNAYWIVYYNSKDGTIKKICLAKSGGKEHELYPNYSEFMKNGLK